MNERRAIVGMNDAYVYGSAARDFGIMPGLNERRGHVVNPEPRAKEHVQVKQGIDFFSIALILVTFVAVMVVGIIYLNLNFQSTYLSKNVVRLQSEVVELQKSNAATQEQLEDGVNLKQIYKKATKKLGMKPMKKSQIVTYQSKKGTEIRQYGEIPVN